MEQPSKNIPAQREQERAAEGGLMARQGARLHARVRPIIQVAEAILGKVRFQAAASGLAGLWLWGVLFYPFSSFGQGWVLALGIIALIALLIPAGVLILFWAGLRELTRVPDKLLAVAAASDARTGDLVQTVNEKTETRKLRRLWRFFRALLDLRTLLLESKELLLQYAVLIRVANPVFLGVLFVAFVASLLLDFAAVVTLMVVAL